MHINISTRISINTRKIINRHMSVLAMCTVWRPRATGPVSRVITGRKVDLDGWVGPNLFVAFCLCGGWLAGDRMAPNTSRNCTNCLDHDSHYLEPKNNEFINAVEKNMLCNAINELLNLLSRTSVTYLV